MQCEVLVGLLHLLCKQGLGAGGRHPDDRDAIREVGHFAVRIDRPMPLRPDRGKVIDQRPGTRSEIHPGSGLLEILVDHVDGNA